MVANPPFSRASLLLGTALSVLAGASLAWLAMANDLSEAERGFHAAVDTLAQQINDRVTASNAVLTSLAGLYHASDGLGDHEFAVLADDITAAYPFIDAILRVDVVPPAARESFEAEIRGQGFTQYRIWRRNAEGRIVPSVGPDRLYPLRAAYPLTPRLAMTLGHDIATDEALWPPAARALSSGTIIATGGRDLANGVYGYTVFKAVYLGHVVPETAATRRAQADGFIAIDVSIGEVPIRAMDRRIDWQLTSPTASRPLISVAGSDHANTGGLLPLLQARRNIALHGIGHELSASRSAHMDDVHLPAVVMLFLLPFVLTFSILSVVVVQRSRRHAMEAAARRLGESEARYRDFAEVASDRHWQADDTLVVVETTERQSEDRLDPGGLVIGAKLDALGDDVDRQEHVVAVSRSSYLAGLEARRPFRDYRYPARDSRGDTTW